MLWYILQDHFLNYKTYTLHDHLDNTMFMAPPLRGPNLANKKSVYPALFPRYAVIVSASNNDKLTSRLAKGYFNHI